MLRSNVSDALAQYTGVPYTLEVIIPEIGRAVTEIRGRLDVGVEGLVFAYATVGPGGLVHRSESILVPWDDVRSVELQGRAWGATVVVRLVRPLTFELVPGVERTMPAFRVKRRDRGRAAVLVDRATEILATKGRDAVLPLPFRLPAADHGFTEITGVVYLDDEFLVFDVETGLPGVRTPEQRLIKIELHALRGMTILPGAFRDRLRITPKTDALLKAMPGKRPPAGVLDLIVRKKHRDAAARLIREARGFLDAGVRGA